MDAATITTAPADPRPPVVAEPQVSALVITEGDIDRTIDQLHEVWNSGLRQMVLDVGRIVIDNIYGGDLDAWRSRGTKDQSFRRLVDRLGNGDRRQLSVSTLSRACGVYELQQRLGVSALKQLQPSHVYAVLGLPGHVQQDLLQQAAAQRWTTREIEMEARKHRQVGEKRRGRKPLPAFHKGLTKALKAIDEAVAEPVPDDLFSTDRYGRYDPDTARQLLERVDRQLDRLAELRAQVEARIDAAPDAGA